MNMTLDLKSKMSMDLQMAVTMVIEMMLHMKMNRHTKATVTAMVKDNTELYRERQRRTTGER